MVESKYDLKPSYVSTTNTDAKLSISQTISDAKLSNQTIRERIKFMAENYPENVAFKFCEPNHVEGLSYSVLKQKVDLVSQSLLNLGLKKGDRVAYQFCHIPEVIIINFACANIGLISVPIAANNLAFHLEYMLQKSGAKCLFIMNRFNGIDYFEIFKEISPEIDTCDKGNLVSQKLPNLKHVVLVEIEKDESSNKYQGVWRYDEISKENTSFKYDLGLPEISCDDPFVILFTSGTTGQRKGCVLSFFKLYNTSYFTYSIDNFDGLINCCNLFSLLGVGGIVSAILAGLYYPVSMIFPGRKIDIDHTIRVIEKHKCRTIMAPPKLLNDIMNSDAFTKHDLSSIEYVYSGGQVCRRVFIERCKKEFNFQKFLCIYGMTESGFVSTSVVESNFGDEEQIESIGKASAFVEFKVVDSKTNEIQPFNITGELLIRAYSTLNYYWDDPLKTKEVLDDEGWLRTGDAVKMDKNGYLFYVERIKDVIDCDYERLFPSEIEACIIEHPSVSLVHVFGVEIGYCREVVCAWIMLKPDHLDTTIDEMKSFCKKKMVEHRVPKYIKFVSDFPTDPATGKILKREMSRIYKQELAILNTSY